MRPLALAALLAVTAAGRADPVAFSYSVGVSADDPFLTTYGPGPVYLAYSRAGDGTGFSLDHGSGMVTFTGRSGDASGEPATFGSASTGVVLGELVFAPNPAGLPVNFGFSTMLPTTVTITDPSGLNGSSPLLLSLGGTTGPDGTTYWAAGSTMGLVEVGGHSYRVELEYMDLDTSGPGVLKAAVYIDEELMKPPPTLPPDDLPVEDPGSVAYSRGPEQAPEPSSLLLLGLGGLGLARWRRRPS